MNYILRKLHMKNLPLAKRLIISLAVWNYEGFGGLQKILLKNFVLKN